MEPIGNTPPEESPGISVGSVQEARDISDIGFPLYVEVAIDEVGSLREARGIIGCVNEAVEQTYSDSLTLSVQDHLSLGFRYSSPCTLRYFKRASNG